MTSDDMFKAAEINMRKVEAAEREKEKKSRVEYHARREAALPIVDRLEHELDNDVGGFLSKELEVLLWWKGVAASKMGNVANRRLLYQQLAEGDLEEVSIPAPWTEIDEAELIALRDKPIEMYDTAYGWYGCVCCQTSGYGMRPVRHAIPIASIPPNDVSSIP